MAALNAAIAQEDSPLLSQLLRASDDAALHQVLEQPGRYQLQLIYTHIDRDSNDCPAFRLTTWA